jgi:hypothetical protein
VPVDPLATRFNPPFALEPAKVFWMMANPYTGNTLDAIKRKPRFAKLGVALIDLSARARRPDGSGWTTSDGWNMDDQRFVASLAKIAALFAAFRLRHNLRIAANETSAKDGNEAFKMVTEDWKGVVQTAIPAGKPDFPQFDKIFTIRGATGAWDIDFTKEYRGHLELMIGHSDNHSASVCIDRLGFQYINGALEAEGLYVAGRGGIWLGGNYAGRAWMAEPSKKLTHQGATASSVARFLTLLEDDRLVSPKDSKEMRAIMRLAGTWLEEGLSRAKPPRPIVDIYAKIGLFGTSHDCAVIQRSANGKAIRYAAVVLGAPDPQVIRDLVVKLDDYIIGNN